MPAVNNQSDPKKQTNVTATTSSEQTTPDISFASMGGDDYPRGKSKYTAYKSIPITPVDHLQHDTSTVVNPEYVHDPSMNDASFYIRAKEHVTRDLNHPDYMDASAIRKGNEADGATFEGEFMRTKFAGSATIINPTDSEPVQALIDPDGFRKQDIVDHMGGDPSKEPTSERLDPPISPLEPFTSLHPTTVKDSVIFSLHVRNVISWHVVQSTVLPQHPVILAVRSCYPNNVGMIPTFIPHICVYPIYAGYCHRYM